MLFCTFSDLPSCDIKKKVCFKNLWNRNCEINQEKVFCKYFSCFLPNMTYLLSKTQNNTFKIK